MKAQRSAHQTFRKEEEYWQLKSKSLWLKAGDQNTSYFHCQYRTRLTRNHIPEIKTLEGTACKGYNQIKATAETYFRNLYREETHNNVEEADDFTANIPTVISSEENTALCMPTTEEEIIKVISPWTQTRRPGLMDLQSISINRVGTL